jgi:hypothetical protein
MDILNLIVVCGLISRYSICCVWVTCFGGKWGILMLHIDWRIRMLGLFCRCAWGWVRATQIALRILWWISHCDFYSLCCFMGRKPPWCFCTIGSWKNIFGHTCLFNAFMRELRISWSLLCASSYCVGELLLLQYFCKTCYRKVLIV